MHHTVQLMDSVFSGQLGFVKLTFQIQNSFGCKLLTGRPAIPCGP